MKLRQILLIFLVITAIGAILLPMQVESPLFSVAPVSIDNRMFTRTLIDSKQAFAAIDARKQNLSANARRAAVAERSIPPAWVVGISQVRDESQAVSTVEALQAKGLPAFYQLTENNTYQIMLGPEVNKENLQTLQLQAKELGHTVKISQYQPV